MGAGVCSSQTMKPMPEMQATAKSRRMESENHPSRCPFDRPLSKVMRNAVLSPKPIQSNLRGDPEVALPGMQRVARNSPKRQKGPDLKNNYRHVKTSTIIPTSPGSSTRPHHHTTP